MVRRRGGYLMNITILGLLVRIGMRRNGEATRQKGAGLHLSLLGLVDNLGSPK